MEVDFDELTRLVMERLGLYLGSGGDVKLLETVTGSTPKTVRRWSVKTPPRGQRMIKLWHILATLGFQSPEMASLSPLNRYCGELLTFGLADMNDLVQIYGLTQHQEILKKLRGAWPMQPGFTHEQLQEIYDDKLQQAKQALLGTKEPPKASQPTQPVPVSPVQVLSESSSGDKLLIAAATFSATLTFARYFASDKATPEERSMLRELMDRPDDPYKESMAELARLTTSLCSERARNHGKVSR